MKASALIEWLEAEIDKNGDNDVVTIDPEYGITDDITSIYFSKGEIILG